MTRAPDLLLVMGTSLKVEAFCHVVRALARLVHGRAGEDPRTHKRIFVNKTQPGAAWDPFFDYHIKGETDAWVERVLKDWRRELPDDWKAPQDLEKETGQIHADADAPGGSKEQGT